MVSLGFTAKSCFTELGWGVRRKEKKKMEGLINHHLKSETDQ